MKVKNSLFNKETAPNILKRLLTEINSPFINGYVSTLGGKDDASIMLAMGTETKEQWTNGIFENSPYRRFSIDNDGTVENFSCSKLSKIRKFTVKSPDNLIEKLNKIMKTSIS